MFFWFVCFLEKNFLLGPKIEPEVGSTYVAQTLNISIYEEKVLDIFISLGDKTYGRMFYGNQLSGEKLVYESDYARKNNFSLHYSRNNHNFITPGNYSFKINTNFSADDFLAVKVITSYRTNFYDASFTNNLAIFFFLVAGLFILFFNFSNHHGKLYSKMKYFMHLWLLFVVFYAMVYVTQIKHITPPMLTVIDDTNLKHSFEVSLNPYYNHFDFMKDTIEEIKKATEIEFNLDKCNGCYFKPHDQPSSTNRDLILLAMGDKINSVIFSVLSLRTTGCRARVVIIMLEKNRKNVNHKVEQRLNDCGIYIVGLNYTYKSKSFNFMKIIRFPLFAEFLSKYPNSFDRALYFDSYDTVFQSDPFTSEIQPGKLYISPEYNPIGNNNWVKGWFDRIPGFNYDSYLDQDVICSGVFGGYTNVVYKLCDMMKALYIYDYDGIDFITEDQGLLDYLIYAGPAVSSGLNPTVLLDYVSAGFIVPYIPYQGIGTTKIFNKTTVLIHHINRNKDYLKNIKKICKL